MILNYNLDNQDYAFLDLYLNKKEKKYKAIYLSFFYYNLYIIFSTLLFVYLFKTLLLGIYAIVIIVFIVLKIFNSRVNYKNSLKNIYSIYGIIDAEIKIEINENWIIQEDETGILKRHVSFIEKVIETDNYFYIKVNKNYFIIPKRKVKDVDTLKLRLNDLARASKTTIYQIKI